MKVITKTVTQVTNISLTEEEVLTLRKAQYILNTIWAELGDIDNYPPNIKSIVDNIEQIDEALDEIANDVDCVYERVDK